MALSNDHPALDTQATKAHKGSSFSLAAMSASMAPNQERFRWKTQTAESLGIPQTIARAAVKRVKGGGDSVKNDTHVRKLIKATAEARYCRQGILKDLSPGAVVTLALSFTAAEWAAVNRDPLLLQETLDYFKTGVFQIDRWWTYWRNLQLEQPNLAKLFLLEIIYEYWKDNATDLINSVVHISNGLPVVNLAACQEDVPAPKRRKTNSRYSLPLKKPRKDSKSSNIVAKSDATHLSSVTHCRPEPQSTGLPYAKNSDDVNIPSQLSTNVQVRKPLSNISLDTTNTHDLDERRSRIVPDTLRPQRTGTINALLNHDDSTPTTAFPTTQICIQGSKSSLAPSIADQEDSDEAATCDTRSQLCLDSTSIPQQSDPASTGAVTPLLRAIRFEKDILKQVVSERPNDILGGIWFGSLPGYPPFVSLRLPRALDVIVKPSSQEVYIPEPPPDASSTVTGTYLIKLAIFRQLIQRDGFGEIFWNDCGEEAFVTMLVVDEGLAEDFIRHAQV